jgi:hypothetical protein
MTIGQSFEGSITVFLLFLFLYLCFHDMTEAFWYFGITIALSFFIVLLSSLPRIIRYGLRRIQCHIGSINMRLRWDSKHGPTVQFLVSDIIHYLIWFEVDKIGGYPSPLPDGDLELCSLLEGKHRQGPFYQLDT